LGGILGEIYLRCAPASRLRFVKVEDRPQAPGPEKRH
jgi:hypothetical protein